MDVRQTVQAVNTLSVGCEVDVALDTRLSCARVQFNVAPINNTCELMIQATLPRFRAPRVDPQFVLETVIW